MTTPFHAMKNRGDTENTESFSIMKHFLRNKFQPPMSQADMKNKNTGSGNAVPKIVISQGSNRSLYRMSDSPLMRKPGPLQKTWLNYNSDIDSIESSSPDISPAFNSTSVLARHKGGHHFIRSGDKTLRHLYDLESESFPASPVEHNEIGKRPHTTSGVRNASPSFMFRFPAKQRLLTELDLHDSASNCLSASDLDSTSVCGSCGQQKYFGSRELVGFNHKTASQGSELRLPQIDSEISLPHIELRRSSSCKYPEKESDKNIGHLSKAVSNIGIPSKDYNMKRKKIKRTGSKERSRSTISLTRTLSLNLDPLKIVRLSTTHDSYNRKMSLNDSELRRATERRRSSLLKFCIEKRSTESNATSDDETKTATSSDNEDYVYSPKVTRTAVFKYNKCEPVPHFKSTFETDSISIPSIYGQVKVMFQFFNDKSEFQVTLLKGSNLAHRHSGTLGVFAKLCLMPGQVQKKVCADKHDTQNPIFYELFSFKTGLGQLLDSQLRIKFYNKPGIFSRTKPIGECSILLYYYDLTAVTVIWQNLRKSKGQKDDLDEFDFGPMESESVPTSRQCPGLLCGLARRRKQRGQERQPPDGCQAPVGGANVSSESRI